MKTTRQLIEIDIPPVLSDLRWVYDHPEPTDDELSAGVTPSTQMLRKMLKESPEKFLAKLQSMEQAHQQTRLRATEAYQSRVAKTQKEKQATTKAAKPVGPDEIEALCQRTLDDCLDAIRA